MPPLALSAPLYAEPTVAVGRVAVTVRPVAELPAPAVLELPGAEPPHELRKTLAQRIVLSAATTCGNRRPAANILCARSDNWQNIDLPLQRNFRELSTGGSSSFTARSSPRNHCRDLSQIGAESHGTFISRRSIAALILLPTVDLHRGCLRSPTRSNCRKVQ